MARRLGKANLRQGRGDGAVEVGVGHRLDAERDLRRHLVRRRLGAGDGDAHALDGDIGHGFGALDGLGDGLGGRFHVDDRAGADALGLHIADASDADRLVGLARAFRPHDEAADLRGAEVERGDQAGRGHRARRRDGGRGRPGRGRGVGSDGRFGVEIEFAGGLVES